jgi:hypothetical protein
MTIVTPAGRLYCDGFTKLHEPTKPDRLILGVAGRSAFHAPHAATDICEHLRQTPPEFDLAAVAKSFIESQERFELLETTHVVALLEHCTHEFASYLATHQWPLPQLLAKPEGTTFVLASYDPVAQVGVVRVLELGLIAVGDKLEIYKRNRIAEVITKDRLAGQIIAGEGDYLNDIVFPRMKSEAVSETTRIQFHDYPQIQLFPVHETSARQARDVAADLIAVASRMTEIIPAPSGIGGPMDVRLIGESPRPTKLD